MSQSKCVICKRHEDSGNTNLIEESASILASHYPIENERQPRLGYVLVETKRHITRFSGLTVQESQELGAMIMRVGQAIERRLGAEHVYVFRIGDLAPHIHFHLIPRYPGTPKEFWGSKIRDYNDDPKGDAEEILHCVLCLKKDM